MEEAGRGIEKGPGTETPPGSSSCPKCGSENPVTVQFCTRCHHLLRYACPACQHLQPHGEKCDACGVDFVEYQTRQLRLARHRVERARAGASGVKLATFVGVAVVVLAVGAWLGSKLLSASPRRDMTARAAVSAPAPPPPARVIPSAADSLRVLRELRGLVQARAGYGEYGPRAVDAKKVVDMYVTTLGGDAELKRDVREAMELYTLGAIAWNAALRVDSGDRPSATIALASVARDPALGYCPAAREARDNAKAEGDVPLEVAQGIGVVSTLPGIFACAESRLDEAERQAAR
jgi:zinc ribbon protein